MSFSRSDGSLLVLFPYFSQTQGFVSRLDLEEGSAEDFEVDYLDLTPIAIPVPMLEQARCPV